MSKPTVYLAGPIDGLHYDEATDWRKKAQDVLEAHGINGIDPMRGKEFLTGQILDAGTEGRATYEHPMSTDKAIMGRDHYDCRTCDLMIANFAPAKKVSVGTVMECAFRYEIKKPLIVVMDSLRLHDHPMLRETFTYSAPTLGHALKIAVAMLEAYT